MHHRADFSAFLAGEPKDFIHDDAGYRLPGGLPHEADIVAVDDKSIG
jgi:hypothetical protein